MDEWRSERARSSNRGVVVAVKDLSPDVVPVQQFSRIELNDWARLRSTEVGALTIRTAPLTCPPTESSGFKILELG